MDTCTRCTYTHTHMHTCTHAHTQKHRNTHTHTETHTHTHTHTHRPPPRRAPHTRESTHRLDALAVDQHRSQRRQPASPADRPAAGWLGLDPANHPEPELRLCGQRRRHAPRSAPSAPQQHGAVSSAARVSAAWKRLGGVSKPVRRGRGVESGVWAGAHAGGDRGGHQLGAQLVRVDLPPRPQNTCRHLSRRRYRISNSTRRLVQKQPEGWHADLGCPGGTALLKRGAERWD